MAKRLAELGALQDAVSNDESSPKRLALAGYIRGLFLDWSANPYNPLSRLTARGRLLGYFWDSGAIGLSMNFADQNYLVKDGIVQSKSFSQIVNFSRTTNATVTNSSGQITYAPHNLLTYSEQFDNAAWTKAGTTISANSVIAPNGTTTADKIVEDTSTGSHTVRQNITVVVGTTYTYSFYVKEAGRSNILVFDVNDSTFCYINLSTKSVTAGTLVPAITDVGNGWLRIATTSTATSTTSRNWVYLVQSGTTISYTGDGTSGVYLWGAQLEIGSTATTYNSTTVKNLLGYSELFDNAAWTKSNSFVQTNLLTYSEDFSNAVWTKDTSAITVNSIVAPNGYQTADKLTTTTASAQHSLLTANISVTSGVTYTHTYYAKKGEINFFFIGWSTPFFGAFNPAYFNLETGEVTTSTGTTATITDVGNGWWRCSATRTATATGAVQLRVGLTDSNTSTTSTGANTTDGIYIWGAQLVQGSVAGDYRRTDAAALPIYYANHNGVLCAEKLVEDTTAASLHRMFATVTTVTGTIYTQSIYAKAGERRYFSIRPESNANAAVFDLQLGTVTNTSVGVTATIIPVGNGWYRCSATKVAAGTAWTSLFNLQLDGSGGGNTYTGDGTSGIYIFGAQLSDSASLDPYVLNAAAAPTAAAYYGARFDYDPVTLLPKGLLIEEQRTNLLLNSSILGTALGTQLVTVTAVAHTLSFYGTGTVAITGTYTGSLVGSGAYPTRSTLTFTPTAGVITLTVTGTVQFAQLEAGAFATSYIPTAASQVTRAADVATIQGSNFYSWINANEGSMVTNFDWLGASAFDTMFAIGTDANNNTFLGLNSSNVQRMVNAYVGTTDMNSIVPPAGGITANTYYKLAGGYKINDYAVVSNNGTVVTDTSVIPPIYNQARIGQNVDGTNGLNGHIKQISYYPQRLSDSVLKGLTA